MSKPVDYESILCTELECSRFQLQGYLPLVKDKVINAMKEAVRQARENFENGEDE